MVGCVAWFSSPRLAAALTGTPVALVLNKEFYLRSTVTDHTSRRKREVLATLQGGLHPSSFPAPLRSMPGPLDPVRVAGVAGRAYGPLMHSKFLVRLRGRKPVAVWTGSLNMTVGSESNIENALEVHDPVLAAAYLEEFARVAAISEPLEFRTGKPAPQSTPRPASKPQKAVKRAVKTRAKPGTAGTKKRRA